MSDDMMEYTDFMAWMKNDNFPFWAAVTTNRYLFKALTELGIEVKGKNLVGSKDYTKLKEYLMNHPLYQIHKI